MEGDSFEESATSTSGLSSSTKRSREKNWEQVSMKRPRRVCEGDLREEESSGDPIPSTSGLRSSIKRRREGNWEKVTAKRQRRSNTENQREAERNQLLASAPPQRGAGKETGSR